MKKTSVILICALVALTACTKSKEVHPELGDGNDEIVTVGTKGIHVEFLHTDHAELNRVVFHYGLSGTQTFISAEMAKNDSFFELTLNDLLSDTLYCYFFELFPNGGDVLTMEQKSFHTQAFDEPEPPVPPTPPSGAPEGAINGLFTINENGDKVYFSQGNLQYQASTNNWRFAEHQWDFVGSTKDSGYEAEPGGTVVGSSNHLISSTYNGWIDLFGWATSGYNHGAVCYQPWSNSYGTENYSAYGNPYYSLYDQTGQADWGYNVISNGGNQINHWRTLSQNEWDYVFNIRTTALGARYAKAQVNGVNGVIVLPDDWDININTLYDINIEDAQFNVNIISASQWATFENAGAVFMPTTGFRHGSMVAFVLSSGYYWSSSSSSTGTDSWQISFTEKTFHSHCDWEVVRFYAAAVRLVQDANP